jgi:RNase adaptor protein for sRNA GlmZ degradation
LKLIFIYGPTGVGKLTVAEALSKQTGYSIFHNHLTVNLARSLFPFEREPYTNLVQKLRLDILRFSARSGLEGLIFTYVAAAQKRAKFLEQFFKLCDEESVEAKFVRLHCRVKVLEERITGESRARFQKVQTVEALHYMLETLDMFSPIQNVESLTIDNSELSPEQVAEQIVRHYRLSVSK